MTRPFALLRIIGEKEEVKVSWSAFVLASWRLVRAGFASIWTRCRGYEDWLKRWLEPYAFRFVLCGLLLAFCLSSPLSLVWLPEAIGPGVHSHYLLVDLPPPPNPHFPL